MSKLGAIAFTAFSTDFLNSLWRYLLAIFFFSLAAFNLWKWKVLPENQLIPSRPLCTWVSRNFWRGACCAEAGLLTRYRVQLSLDSFVAMLFIRVMTPRRLFLSPRWRFDSYLVTSRARSRLDCFGACMRWPFWSWAKFADLRLLTTEVWSAENCNANSIILLMWYNDLFFRSFWPPTLQQLVASQCTSQVQFRVIISLRHCSHELIPDQEIKRTDACWSDVPVRAVMQACSQQHRWTAANRSIDLVNSAAELAC